MSKIRLAALSPKLDINTKATSSSRRIWELDFLRGFTIILMVIDHFMYDLAYMFSDVWQEAGGAAGVFARFALNWWNVLDTCPFPIGATRDVIQKIAICIFFGLCGGSTNFSHDNCARSLKTLLAASFITISTYTLVECNVLPDDSLIIFGVLHMLALSTIIVSIIHYLSELSKTRSTEIFCMSCILLAAASFLASEILNSMDLVPNENLLFLHEGFCSPQMGIKMGDYFPLLPNLGIVLIGGAVIRVIYYRKKSLLPSLDRAWNKPVCFVGRHTIFIVIVHQVVNVLLLACITAIFVDKGNFVLF